MEEEGPAPTRFITGLFLLVFGIFLLAFGAMVWEYITALILALVLVSLFEPLNKYLRVRLKKKKKTAAGLATFAVFVVVVVPLGLLLMSLSSEAITLYQKAVVDEDLFSRITKFIQPDNAWFIRANELTSTFGFQLSTDKMGELTTGIGKEVGLYLYDQVGSVAGNALRIMIQFSMMLIFIYGFFAEGDRLKPYLLDLSPLPDEQEEMMFDQFTKISRAVFLGNGTASVLQGIAGGIGFALFDAGSPILWGTAIGFFAFLPMVGASVVVIPAAIILFFEGHTGAALGFLAYTAVYVAILEYPVKTRLIGNQSHMNSVLIFFGIVAGMSLFGILGIFYGPLILAMFLTLSKIYKEYYRQHLM